MFVHQRRVGLCLAAAPGFLLTLISIPFAQTSPGRALEHRSGAPPSSASSSDHTELVGHVLRRMAYGPNLDSLDRIEQMGLVPYLNEQLNPSSIQETPGFESLLSQIPVSTSPYGTVGLKDLVRMNLLRAIYSRKQLQEQMVDFWENHFNTDYWTLFRILQGPAQARTTYLEWQENELFRQNSLGKFRDLLYASATGPNMIIYLDNDSNSKLEPNENFARELLELHTLGVDNLYTEQDVQEVARAFTGWSVCQVAPHLYGDPHAVCNTGTQPLWSFRYKHGRHDEGQKILFEGTPWELVLPPRSGPESIQDGYDVLDHLASLPHTAEFVCSKLIQKFLRDDPKPRLVSKLRDRWLATDGDIREVLRALFLDPAFRWPALRWNKVRTPLEALVATVRGLDGQIDQPSRLDALSIQLEGVLNQPLFRWATPDGYPEIATAQTGAGKLLGGFIFKKFIYESPYVGVTFDVRSILEDNSVPLTNTNAITNFFADYLFPGNLSMEERVMTRDFLATDDFGQAAPLDPSLEEEYDRRLNVFCVYLLSLPQFIQQ